MRHLSAIAIVVPDYDAALEFYVGKLGWSLIEDTDMGDGKRWVIVAPSPQAQTRIVIARAVNSRQHAAIGNQTGGRVGLFLTTETFDADHATMVAAGAVFEETPRHESYGRVAVWRDPFGNRWDLLGPAD